MIFVQSGPQPRFLVANFKSGALERTIPIGAANPENTHGQLRHARLTSRGTYLLAQMDLKRAVEIDEHGKEIWQLAMPGIWSAEELANGNLLVSGKGGVAEVTRDGKAVWTLTPADLAAYGYTAFQTAVRLPNGNTLVNHWVNQWNAPNRAIDTASAPPQWLEVTPDKKVVWVLRQWKDPNLGPSTILQLLDAQAKPENVRFGSLH